MDPNIGLVQPQETDLAAEELAAVEKLQQGYHNLRTELGKVIVGQEAVIEELLIALFCRGHALLVGVPGLAKTLLISTLAKTLGLELQPHSVHAGPDAVGHHRHRGDRRRQDDRRPRRCGLSAGRSLPT